MKRETKIDKLQEEYKELMIAIKYQQKNIVLLQNKADKKLSQLYDLTRDNNIKPKL